MSEQNEIPDSECEEKGIPTHLHQVGREPDDTWDEKEILYRRIRKNTPDLTAEIKFDRMSVNRSRYCKGPDDVLWNEREGGISGQADFGSGFRVRR